MMEKVVDRWMFMMLQIERWREGLCRACLFGQYEVSRAKRYRDPRSTKMVLRNVQRGSSGRAVHCCVQ